MKNSSQCPKRWPWLKRAGVFVEISRIWQLSEPIRGTFSPLIPSIDTPNPNSNTLIQSFTMSLPTHFTLNTGAKIPAVGFGTWQAPNDEVVQAVKTALKTGYRHIDAAAIYRNEAAVGEGIRQSGVPRSEIFITGKLWNTKHDPKDVEGALDKTLKDLGTDYLDLFLIHWPV